MALTPIIKSGIVAHFTGILKVDKARPAVGERNKFKVRLEGEAITSDDFVELMEADQAEKAHKEAERDKKGGRKRQERDKEKRKEATGECVRRPYTDRGSG